MKSTLTFLLLLFAANILFAQDTIRSLVITEARLDFDNLGYIEITNMGELPVQLNQFELGKSSPLDQLPFQPPAGSYFMLPYKLLQPGESFVICAARDYGPEQFAKGIEDAPERTHRPELINEADLVIHLQESDPVDSNDSVSFGIWETFDFKSISYGQLCYYIEQHLPNGDSVLIDQVNGPRQFRGEGGALSVAGVLMATGACILVRKFSIKTGNLDFMNARGIGDEDSEWIVVNIQGREWRKPHWTVGNHLDAHIYSNTLVSEFADVDFDNKTITIPWGTRKADDIIQLFEKKPGIAWNYHLNNNPEDSLSIAAKTGDKLEIIACGNKVQRDTFTIIVAKPSVNSSIVIPKVNETPDGQWRWNLQMGITDWPRVTRHETGQDTIWGFRGGIPYATRLDSLFERLEKAPLAKWEIVWVDGIKRPDLKNGDKLKITAEDKTIKEYLISVFNYLPNHDAFLSSITWPDIPEESRGINGWKEDTIPDFYLSKFDYVIKIPENYNRIPSLVAKTYDLNANIKITPAKNLVGTKEDRTIKFTVTAEDKTTQMVYSVLLEKEKLPENIQPFFAEPFLSELVFQDQWFNGWIEIYNPGSQPLDLSNYMFSFVWGDKMDGITFHSGKTNWNERYNKYIPGYKWVDEKTWEVNPARVIRDLNVNQIVNAGDVFVAGQVNYSYPYVGNYWWATDASDVLFDTKHNPWREEYNNWGSAAHQWIGANWYLYKILNDSIKLGLKPANDPDDFDLIETFGYEDNSLWKIDGKVIGQLTTLIRKPNITQGKTGYGESFGTDSTQGEWIVIDSEDRAHLPDNLWHSGATVNLGAHMMNEITHYKSTISSEFYKVSEGYSLNENIRGIITGTTVNGFLSKIIKADSSQILTIKNFDNGIALQPQDLLHMNDTLVVLSADSTNTTRYIIEVTEKGLSSNAYLTSNRYNISVLTEPDGNGEKAGEGTVKGFEYGTTLSTILANISVSDGAALSVQNGQGSYIPTKMFNFNKTYISVIVNTNFFISVIAENGINEMRYHLVPDGTENDAFLLSNVYYISQKDLLIKFVPRGSNVFTFLENLFPSRGASIKVINKMGQERVDGLVAADDRVVVVSENKLYTKVYFISMLPEKYVPETTYLAYILSEVYPIDQVNYIIYGVSSETSVIAFLAKISPAIGASAVLADKDGIEKTNGFINGSDMVRITSRDGKTIVYYTFAQVTSSTTKNFNKIEIYPNPTDNKIFLKGIHPGYRITVYNALGSKIKEIKCKEWDETISMEGKPTGIYLFQISDGQKVLGNYKIIKR